MKKMNNRICLSDSFESQKKAARAVSNGLLDQEVRAGKMIGINQKEIEKAKIRRKSFAKQYGF